MPNINALTGSVRLLKSDERIATQFVALVDCLVENCAEIFGEDESLSVDFELVREPLGRIADKIAAKLNPAKPTDASNP